MLTSLVVQRSYLMNGIALLGVCGVHSLVANRFSAVYLLIREWVVFFSSV